MLTFRFGTMNSGKSTDLILRDRIANNAGITTLIVKPTFDTRDGSYLGFGPYKSRCMESTRPALYVKNLDLQQILDTGATTIFIDEVQFFTPKDVETIVTLSDTYKKDVSCYGLKTDVRGKLFDTTEKLLAIADRVECVRDMECELCGGKWASHHLRYIDGKLDTSGKSKLVERGAVSYLSVCRKCWNERQRT